MTHRMTHRASHRILRNIALPLGVLVIPVTTHAQSQKSAPIKAAAIVPARTAKTSGTTAATSIAKPVAKSLSSPGARVAGAWALPEADALVERVYARIIRSDRPGAVPIAEYQRKFFGREATLDAVRRFTGRTEELAPSAFAAVDGWTDAEQLKLPACEGPGCPAPVNSIWLAITRIERGEVPSEVFVWYTTHFAAESPSGPTRAAYAFCERWVRVASGWKYEGFVRVKSLPVTG